MAQVQPSLKKKTPAGKKMPKADFITSILLMVVSVYIIIESLNMPRFEHRNINPYTIPGLVPAVLGVIIAVLSVALFIRSIMYRGYILSSKTTADAAETGSKKKWAFFRKPETIRVLLTVGFCLLYAIILVGWVWYPIATFVYTFGFIAFFEYERGKPVSKQIKMFVIAAIEALLTAALVSVVFRYLFLIRLP